MASVTNLEVPNYFDDFKDLPKISKDNPVDVIALLSSPNFDLHRPVVGHGFEQDRTTKASEPEIVRNRDFLITKEGKKVPVDSVKGKYLLICCFLLPVPRSSATFSRAVIALFSELPEKDRHNLQLVIVPKFKTGLDPLFLKDFYSEFVSAFPDNSLSIPPWDYYSCDYVCKSLKLCPKKGEAALIVDPQQMVLQDYEACYIIERWYGAHGFPFTKTHLNDLLDKFEMLKLRLDRIEREYRRRQEDADKLCSVLVSLEELVECHFFSNIEDQHKVVPLSYFKDKLVGLYIYFDSRFIEELGRVLDKCDEEGRPFEIVLIRGIGYWDDPHSALEHVLHKLQEHEISTSNWWIFPFNNSVTLKLWRICDFDEADKLIIVPPPGDKNRSGDLQGKVVMLDYGGFDSYPFTRETILERHLAALSSITLESVLKEYDHLVRNKNVTRFSWGEKEDEEKKWTVADLRGKNVLLYFDDFGYKSCGSYLDDICSHYSKIQANYPGSEVVFAPLYDSGDLQGEVVSKMPWLVVPFYSPCVREQLLLNDGNHHAGFVAFGKDGRVHSRKGHWNLDKAVGLFDDHLRDEILEELYQLRLYDDFN